MPRVRPPLGAGNPPEGATPNESPTTHPQDAPAIVAPSEPRSLPTTPNDLAPLWSKIIRAEGLSPLLRAILINSALTSFENGKATITCLPRYAKDANIRWRANIAELIAKESNSTSPIEIIINGGETAPTAPESPHSSRRDTPTPPRPAQPAAPAQLLTNPSTHPLVQQAIELFGGRIVDIQPRKR